MDELNLDNSGVVDEEEVEEEAMTAAQVFSRMEDIWLNEKFSPALRPHKSDVVDCIVQQLRAMELNLERIRKNDLKACIHRMEMERIRYVLRSSYSLSPA